MSTSRLAVQEKKRGLHGYVFGGSHGNLKQLQSLGEIARRKLGLNSYEVWGRWCRDPLIALGCADPVERVRQAKQADPKRRHLAELFGVWQAQHGHAPMKVAELAQEVLAVLDPQTRGRQYCAQRLRSMIGTRADGYVLTFQPPAGKWGASTYALMPTPDAPVADNRAADAEPMHPIGPMPEPFGEAASKGRRGWYDRRTDTFQKSGG